MVVVCSLILTCQVLVKRSDVFAKNIGLGCGVQGQSPWWRVRGRSPLQLKVFLSIECPR